MGFKSILCISDMHQPYSHPDVVPFLKALKKKYRPDKVICIGDEVDKHAMSFHDSDPDLMSAGDELQEAIQKLKPIYKLFPVVDVISSNHGDMAYRKAKHHGIPRKYLRDYGDVLEAPEGWVWHTDLVIESCSGRIYFHHGKTTNVLKLSQSMGMSAAQGHYHNQFNIQYWGNPMGLYWGMQIGCLIDDSTLAFHYNRTTMHRPVIGCAAVIDGLPKLLPLVMNKGGGWNGECP